MENDKDIRFIAKHFRKGLFNTEATLKRVKSSSLSTRHPFMSRMKVAAVVGAVVVLGATASIILRNHFTPSENEIVEKTLVIETTPEKIDRVIDFEDTPLPIVVTRIREVYGVEITGLPDDAEEYTLSLHYEGNAEDLIQTINDTLDTKIRIDK